MNREKKDSFLGIFGKITTIVGIIGALVGAYFGLCQMIGIKTTINSNVIDEGYFSNKDLITFNSSNQISAYRSDFIPQFHIEMPFKYINNDIKKITVIFPDFEEGIKTTNLDKPNLGNEDIEITLSSDSTEKTVSFFLKLDGKQDMKEITAAQEEETERLFKRLSIEQCSRRGDFFLGVCPYYRTKTTVHNSTMYFDYFVINIKTNFGQYNYIAFMFTPSNIDNGSQAYVKIYDIEKEYDTIIFKDFCKEYSTYVQSEVPEKNMLKGHTEESGIININHFLYFENEKVIVDEIATKRIETTIAEFIRTALGHN